MRDEEAVRRFVEQLAMNFADWGFPRMSARVLMTMMAADDETLTAAELGERLGVSPAAISGAVRYLVQIRMLVREPVPGSRRDHYRLPSDVWYVAMVAEQPMLKTIVQLAAEGTTALGGRDTPAGSRVAQMHDYFEFIIGEMPALLDKWKAQRENR